MNWTPLVFQKHLIELDSKVMETFTEDLVYDYEFDLAAFLFQTDKEMFPSTNCVLWYLWSKIDRDFEIFRFLFLLLRNLLILLSCFRRLWSICSSVWQDIWVLLFSIWEEKQSSSWHRILAPRLCFIYLGDVVQDFSETEFNGSAIYNAFAISWSLSDDRGYSV